jgi:hypothetical protein
MIDEYPNLSEDYKNIGRILMLHAFRDMKEDNVNLNEIKFDEKIEEVYRNILHPDLFSRDGLVGIVKDAYMDEYLQETVEEMK